METCTTNSDQVLLVGSEGMSFSGPITMIIPNQYDWSGLIKAMECVSRRQAMRGRFWHWHKGHQKLKRGNPFRHRPR